MRRTYTLKDILYNPETGEFSLKADPWRKVGTVTGRGYRVVKIGGKTYRCSRLAWYLTHGAWPSKEIDHINRNKLDDKISNLRDTTREENQINIPARTSSGEKGIYWRGDCGKWIVLVRRNYELIYLGLFPSLEKAKEIRDKYLEVNS